ncbi:MAG: LruC domain-containing protein [Bacteroidales bacterium]
MFDHVKIVIYTFFFLVFTSCLSDISDFKTQNTDFKELSVNPNFVWKTTKNVVVKFSFPFSGVIIVSSIDGGMQFYKGFCDSTKNLPSINITVPTYITQLQVNSEIVNINDTLAQVDSFPQLRSAKSLNYSLSLNGTTDWVSIPNSANVLFNNSFTLEAWVKADRQQTAKIIQKGDWDGFSIGQDLYKGWMASVELGDMTNTDVNWGNGQPLLNRWYHVAAAYENNVLKLYVDGALVNSQTTSAGDLHKNGRLISIGSDAGNQKFFKGKFDDVSIWSKSLTGSEIMQGRNLGLSGSESGLVALWKFDEGSGYLVNSSVITNLPGTLVGGFSLDTGYGVDNDNDGVLNGYDDYPNDASRAFNNYFPAGGFGSLAFEDNWPSAGDYDFNDLIVDYQFKNVTDSRNKLVETYATFILKAAGASFRNGFGFQLAGNTIPESAISVSGSKLSEGLIATSQSGLESNQNKPTLIVFDNAFKCINYQSGLGVNTSPNQLYSKPDTIVLHITYTPNTYSASDLNIAAFNPFIFIDQARDREVHLMDYPPTALANLSYFGKNDDVSSIDSKKYYRSAKNLPWAINIYQKFDYPFENVGVLNAYTHLSDWAQSNGLNYPDWYENKVGYRNNNFIYK